MTRRDSLLAALVACCWGFNFIAVQWGMHGVPPLMFLAIRFVFVVLPAVFLIERPDVSWRVLAAIGLTMSLGQFGFLYVGMHAGMPSGLASLVLQAQVPLTVLIASAALRERPSRFQIAGVVLGVAGLLVVAAGRGGHVPLGALLLCLVAALCWACGNTIVRATGAPGGLGLTVWSAVVVPIPAMLLSLAIDGPHAVGAGFEAFGWHAALSTTYTVLFSSFVGYGLFNSLLARNPAAAVVPWIMLVPPVGVVCSWIFFSERPSVIELVGGVLLVAGVLVANRVRRPARSLDEAEAVSAERP